MAVLTYLDRDNVLEGLRLIGIEEPENALSIDMTPHEIVVTYSSGWLDAARELATFTRTYRIGREP
jgi:hypothetical protein